MTDSWRAGLETLLEKLSKRLRNVVSAGLVVGENAVDRTEK